MLYVSTTSKTDSFTPHRTLCQDAPGDGGQFVPLRLPILSAFEVRERIGQSFYDVVADILNLFFSAKLLGANVEQAVGGRGCKIVSMSHKLYVGELWHNPAQIYSDLEEAIFALLSGRRSKPTRWAGIAIRISVLFGLFGELLKNGIHAADIAVTSGDFRDVMAAWYARKMGLPINTIVICCNDSSGIWDLLRNGELSVAAINKMKTRGDQPFSEAFSQLLFEVCGREEVLRFRKGLENGEAYRVDPQIHQALFAGIECAVVRSDRAKSLIRSIYRTHHYIMEPGAAMTHAALQEYRATAGENCPALILSNASPMVFADLVGSATGLTLDEIKEILTQP